MKNENKLCVVLEIYYSSKLELKSLINRKYGDSSPSKL